MTKIIVPGEEVPLEFRDYTYIDNKKNYSTEVSLLKDENKRLIPLSGPYIPRIGDAIIGIIKEVKHSGYIVYLNAPYNAYLNSRRNYREYEVISAKITDVDEVKSVTLGFERRLDGGEIIEAPTSKVARIIGKKGSMLSLLQNLTGSEIQVGKNGLVWIKGGDTKKLKEALKLIENEAHLPGLTDKMKTFLEEKPKLKKEKKGEK